MTNSICITIFIFFLSINNLSSQHSLAPHTYPYDSTYYQEVAQSRERSLQLALSNIVASDPLYAKLAARKRLAIGLVDLRNEQNIRYAAINGNHMMYAASLPKIAVLLTAMEAVDEGCLNYDKALKTDLRRMISKSNNGATTRVIERVGFDKIASVMTSDRYKLYDKKKGGGLWVGKKYAKAGTRNPDPLKGISHAATVNQVCRFYTMLAYGKFVNPDLHKDMMAYMINPGLNHKFVGPLRALDPKAHIYRKSGSWRQFHSDSVLVDGSNGRRYILVALIEDPSGGKICKDLLYKVELALGLGKTIPKEPQPVLTPVISPASGLE